MAGIVQEILMRIRGDSSEAVGALNNLQAASDGAKTSLKTVQTGADDAGIGLTNFQTAALVGSAAVAALTAGAVALGKAIAIGQPVSEAAHAFEVLSGGAEKAETLLTSLAASTGGLISKLDLMREANQVLAANIAPEKLIELAEAADALGDAAGIDAKDALDKLTDAMIRGNDRMLEGLGVFVDTKQALRDYAEELGKTVGQLTEFEKKQAIQNAILEAATTQAIKLGDAQDTAGDKLQKLGVIFGNYINDLAQAVNENEALIAILGGVIDFIGGTIVVVEKLSKAIADLIGYLPDLSNTFDALKKFSPILNATLAPIDAVVAGVDALTTAGRESAQQLVDESKFRREAKRELEGWANEAEKAKPKVEGINEKVRDHAKALKEVTESQKLFGLGTYLSGVETTFDKAQKGLDEAIEKAGRKQEETFQRSADFFSDAVYDALTGAAYSAEDVLKSVFSDVAGGFLAELTGGVSDIGAIFKSVAQDFGASLLSGNFSDVLSGIPGLISGNIGPIANGGTYGSQLGIGAGFGSLAGAGAIGLTGIAATNAFNVLTEGPDAAMFGFQRDLLNKTKFFGGRSESEQIRDSFRESFRGKATDENDSFKLFGGGTGTLSPGGENYEFSGDGKFAGLGNIISIVTQGNVDEQLSAMFANALEDADSFNAAALTTVGLLEKMGYNAEQVQAKIIEAYANGEISLEEFNAALDEAQKFAVEDLETLEEAFTLFGESLDGTPADGIKSLKLLFKEFADSGITDVRQMYNIIEQKLGKEAAEIFKKLTDAGIDDFKDFSSLSNEQLQLVFNIINDIGRVMGKLGEAGERAGDNVDSGLKKVNTRLTRIRKDADDAYGSLRRVSEAA